MEDELLRKAKERHDAIMRYYRWDEISHDKMLHILLDELCEIRV